MIVDIRNIKIAILGAALAAALPAAASAQHGEHPGGGILLRVLGAIGGQAREIDGEAMHVYRRLPRSGSCPERRDHLMRILPEALRLSRYASDIYDRSRDAEMKTAKLATLDVGDGHRAYFEAEGQRYAEVRLDQELGQAVVVFRGTRLAVGSDMATNVLNLIGVETDYYDWASSLVAQVAREHAGMSVIATG